MISFESIGLTINRSCSQLVKLIIFQTPHPNIHNPRIFSGGSHLPRQQHRGPAQLHRDSAGSNSTSGGSGVGLRNSFRRAQSAEDTEDRESNNIY